jgi:hypothetical protein
VAAVASQADSRSSVGRDRRFHQARCHRTGAFLFADPRSQELTVVVYVAPELHLEHALFRCAFSSVHFD